MFMLFMINLDCLERSLCYVASSKFLYQLLHNLPPTLKGKWGKTFTLTLICFSSDSTAGNVRPKIVEGLPYASEKDLFSSALYSSPCNTRKCRFQETKQFEGRGENEIFFWPFSLFLFLALFYVFIFTEIPISSLKQYLIWQRQSNKLPTPISD